MIDKTILIGEGTENDFGYSRKCGVITCLHNVINKCGLEDCDMFEKVLIQES